MGDDFFLQLVMKYVDSPNLYRTGCKYSDSEISWLKNTYCDLQFSAKGSVTSGTVQSGLSISGALERLKNITSLSSKVVILLGAEDIYQVWY